MKKIFYILLFCVFYKTTFAITNKEKINFFFKLYDTNKDNIVTKQDMEEYSVLTFKRADTNIDRKLSKSEFLDLVCQNTCLYGDSCECAETDDKTSIGYLNNYFLKVDVNTDGNISLKEFINSNVNDMVYIDFNNDNIITKDEVIQFYSK